MQHLRRASLVEQTANHLRQGFLDGRWVGKLPGEAKLASELGVSRDTVHVALKSLENEGVLAPASLGKPRRILSARERTSEQRILRIGWFANTRLDEENSHSQELFLRIKNAVEAVGYVFVLAEKSIEELGNDVTRVAKFIQGQAADAWIVYSGTREVLAWLATMPVPVLAIGGRSKGLPLATARTDLSSAINHIVDSLVEQGHRRIVLVSLPLWRQPSPAPAAQAFLNRLEHHRLRSSTDYNLPEWNETPEGMNELLESLFFATPPTALLLSEPMYVLPIFTFLASRGLRVPQHVSVISLMPDPVLRLNRLPLAHLDWPILPHVHRAISWLDSVVRGDSDRNEVIFHATFVPAGTIAPAK